MRAFKATLATLALAALTAGAVSGQAGNPDYKFIRSGPPVMMDIVLNDVAYDFQGTASIPFTLRNSRAHIWLVIYTKDQPTQEGFGGPRSPISPNGALWRQAGIPNLVTVIDKGQFNEGSHTITWDGTDREGNAVPAGTYSLYVIGLNDQDDANLVGVTSNGLTNQRGDVLLDGNGQGWIIGIAKSFPIDITTDPDNKVWATWGNHVLMNKIGETDLLANPHDVNLVFVPNNSATWTLAINPDNIYEQFGASLYDNPDGPQEDDRQLGSSAQGISAWVVDPTLAEAAPKPTFGDEKGQIPVLNPEHNKYRGMRYHAGRLYVCNGGLGGDPPPSNLYVLDAATGDVIDVFDFSEYFMGDKVDSESGEVSRVSQGPGSIYVDESGIYLGGSSGGRDEVGAPFMKVDFDGNPIWINYNGDGFGDVISQATADALGMQPVALGVQLINVASNKFGVIPEVGPERLHWGAVFGPDGSGLFHIDIAKAPQSPDDGDSGIDLIAEGSAFDGIYYVTLDSEFESTHRISAEVAHAPFRIAEALIGTDLPTAVAEISDETPDDVSLGDAYPNPFNPATTIEFTVVEEGHASLTVYNASGQRVTSLVDEVLTPGTYRADWDGTDASGQAVSSGAYFYTFQSGTFVDRKSMVLLK